MADLGSISGFAQGLDPGNLFGMFDSGVLGSVYFFLKVAIYMAILLGIGIAVWKLYFQNNIRVAVYSRIGEGGIEVRKDYAKITTDKQNKRKLQLFKMRNGKRSATLPIPPSGLKGKMGRFDHYNLWKDDNGEFHPISNPITVGEVRHMEIYPQERAAWARNERKLIEEKFNKKDLLAKWAPAAILLGAMITAFLIWFFAAKELGNSMSTLAGTFRQIASSCSGI